MDLSKLIHGFLFTWIFKIDKWISCKLADCLWIKHLIDKQTKKNIWKTNKQEQYSRWTRKQQLQSQSKEARTRINSNKNWQFFKMPNAKCRLRWFQDKFSRCGTHWHPVNTIPRGLEPYHCQPILMRRRWMMNMWNISATIVIIKQISMMMMRLKTCNKNVDWDDWNADNDCELHYCSIGYLV